VSAPRIGRTVRRLRQEQNLTQQALAVRLGISASYLNLIEHEQRAVTASLLIKLGEALRVDLAALSGNAERQLEAGLREAFADPLLGAEPVPDVDLSSLAASSPAAARAVLALYRAWRVTREDASGIALPSGRRLLLPTEEARDAFHERGNHFPALEEASEAIGAALAAPPADLGHAIAERLRSAHGLTLRVGPLDGAQSRHDPAARMIWLSEALPAESRAFHLAFQLAFLEARETVESIIESIAPSSTEATALIRIGLLNYAAGALLMPYDPFRREAMALRHDVERLAARFAVSFEQACHRLSTLQRPNRDGRTHRGVPFFFLRLDPAGNVSKRFSAAGFPFARYGGSCPRWVVHAAFATPGSLRVQVARLPDGATFVCFARTVAGPPVPWGEPEPVHVVAMGCDVAHAGDVVYADGLDLEAAVVGIGLSCRLCDRQNCRSRAFPPLDHRLALDPLTTPDTPYRFTK
jgi:predicted transcriptional regulator/transcriptional regulator with XRE-family HTH domain